MRIFNEIEEAYVESLSEVQSMGQFDPNNNIELFNYGFVIKDLKSALEHGFVINNKARAFKDDYAARFFDWIMAGKTDPSELIPANANAANFKEIDGRNTAYGPRILTQLPFVIEELHETPSSRRAVINILEAEDKILLKDKREGNSKMEYPCTNAITFFIRDGKLHSHVQMRSNNMTTTICYDLYNFIFLQAHVLKMLNELRGAEDQLELGDYYHNITNAHIISKERGLANSIISEYYSERPHLVTDVDPVSLDDDFVRDCSRRICDHAD